MDAEAIKRQINQALQCTNNKTLSSFPQLLENSLNAVQVNIRKNQNIITKRQEAKNRTRALRRIQAYKTLQRGIASAQRQSYVQIEGGK